MSESLYNIGNRYLSLFDLINVSKGMIPRFGSIANTPVSNFHSVVSDLSFLALELARVRRGYSSDQVASGTILFVLATQWPGGNPSHSPPARWRQRRRIEPAEK